MVAPLIIAKTSQLQSLAILPNMANRHGLITGATGTGKTVTLQKIAESFSSIGVPVFMADVKGDLSGIGVKAELTEKLQQRLQALDINNWQPKAAPVVFWDVFGKQGHPMRATISDVGPLLIARLLGLNAVQSGLLQIIFKVADDNNLLLLDLKDLRSMTQYVGEHADELKTNYGNITIASIGAIQRGLLTLEEQGGKDFFGEPMLEVKDLMLTNDQGEGLVNILVADKLYNLPILYSIFLLWLLSEFYESLPEVGDLAKPKLVFFFDEAHLLFSNANNALLEKIEQVIRLIRSKGVGIFFVTQNPLDIPDRILGQLGNRVQHALRAFSVRDQKAVKAAAQTMRSNPACNAEQIISELAVGEALVSFLDAKGVPCLVERASVIAPCSKMGILTQEERSQLTASSNLFSKYDKAIDRESAYELLSKSSTTSQRQRKLITNKVEIKDEEGGLFSSIKEFLFGKTGPRGGKYQGLVQKASLQATKQLTNGIIRGILGNITGTSKRKK